MGRVRTGEKYIGDAIRNKLDIGDEVCVHLEDGTYLNREVTMVERPGPDDLDRTEVTLGDVDGVHIVLAAEVTVEEEYGPEEWTVEAFSITEDSDRPKKEMGEPDALYKVGEGLQMPDITYEEALEEFGDEEVRPPQELHDQMDEIIKAAKEVKRTTDKVQANDITLSEMEVRLDSLETSHGGRLPFD